MVTFVPDDAGVSDVLCISLSIYESLDVMGLTIRSEPRCYKRPRERGC